MIVFALGQGIRQNIALVAGIRSLKKNFPGFSGGCTQLELTETLFQHFSILRQSMVKH